MFILIVLTKTRNDLKRTTTSKKQPKATLKDVQRARNELKRSTTTKKWLNTTHNEQKTTGNDLWQSKARKKRHEATNCEQETTWNNLQQGCDNLKRLHRTEPSFMESIYSKNNHVEGSIVTKKEWIISVVEIFCIMCAYERKNKANVRTKRSKTLNNDLIR